MCIRDRCGATQSLPLRGGAVTLQNNYPFKNFDKIEFRDLDGDIKVEIGQKWSVKVNIPENLFPLLKVEKEDGENQLLIELKDNKNNRLYVEDSKIWIQITMPEASVIRSIGNQNVEIKGIMGRYIPSHNSFDLYILVANAANDGGLWHCNLDPYFAVFYIKSIVFIVFQLN